MKVQVNDDTSSLHKIGEFVMEYTPYANAFANAIVNRIGMTIVTSKAWNNPWARFKQGTLELGETIEDIFANIANPVSYDPEDAESTLYKRTVPDIRAAFYVMNWQKVYPTTVSEEQLRTAFISWGNITSLIAAITESLYTSLALDEFLTMRYMIARSMLNHDFYSVAHASIDTTPSDAIVKYRQVTNDLKLLKTKFNRAGVRNSTPVAEQVIIMPNDVEAKLGVNVLADAFNLNQVDYIGNRIELDSWYFDGDDEQRLALLFENDTTYKPFTADEKKTLASVSAFKCDERLLMIFDNLNRMASVQNAKGLYFNYFLHAWKTFAISPFKNAVVFTSTASTVTGITVTPTTATVTKNSSTQFSATVKGTGLYSRAVQWSVTGGNSSDTRIDPFTGVLHVGGKESSKSLTVTATSTFDGSISGTAAVTVS